MKNKGINGDLEFVAENRTDEQGIADNKRKSETNVTEERIRLKTEGDIYHPDFLLFNAAVGLGLAQQRINSDEASGSNSESLDTYDFFAQLLRKKPYPLSFYANKSESLIPRQFLGSLRTDRENSGGSLFLRSKWPMVFQYNTSKTSQDSLTSLTSDFFQREDEKFNYSLSHDFSESSHISFDFEKSDISQKTVGATIKDQAEKYSLLHNLTFGSQKQNNLNSFFYYVNQTGSFDFKNLQWEERLRLQHTKSFLTNYDLRYTDSKRDTIISKETRGQVGFEHKLFESLVTAGSFFASSTNLDTQGDLFQRGGILGFNYRKKNPWGFLLSSYSTSLTRSRQSGGTGTGVVINEPHNATELIPVELDRTNIDISSIRVKDSSGLLYQEGEDYIITQINGRVLLNIITVGGVTPPNFIEGEEFFVDYNFFVEPERKEETIRQIFTVRERLENGLSLYFSHRKQNQDVSSTVTDITADEFTANTVGTDFNKQGLFLQAEYSDEKSTQIPSRRKMIQGRYSRLIGKNTNANGGVSNQWLDFGEPDARDVVLFKAGAELSAGLTKNCSVSARTNYRDENDSRLGVTRGFQINSELKYNIRQLSITTGVEINSLDRRNDKIDGSFLYFQLKRFF
ncbi:MAG: hypothetical protein P8016_02230 [Sedimentisphaerales bacterium]